MLQSLTTRAAALLASVDIGNKQSAKDAIEQAPVIFNQLQELEKLQQSRLDDINRCHDQWRSDVSARTSKREGLDQRLRQQQDELTSLNQRLGQQQDEANKMGRELGSLASQRMDAHAKLAADREASERHEQHIRQEDLRIDGRSTALDDRDQQLDAWQADLNRVNQALNQDQHTLAERVREESERAEVNKRKSARLNRRMDLLTDYQTQKDRQVAEYTSRLEDRDRELSNLRTIEAEKADLNSSLVHLTGVILPQKEAELTGLRAQLAQLNKDTNVTKKELSSRIGKLSERALSLEGQVKDQSNQLSQLDDEKRSLQRDADERAKEAEATKVQLSVAEETIVSMTSEVDRLRKREAELQAEVNTLRPCRIDFDGAKRIQDASNAKILDLEQERDRIHQERDNIGQQLEELRTRHQQQSAEARKNIKLHDEAMKRETESTDMVRRRLEAAETGRYQVTEENTALRAEGDRLSRENQRLRAQRDQVTRDHEELTAEYDDLQGLNADLKQVQQDMSDALEETEHNVERLTEQLQSCRCSGGTSSRKRPRHQEDSSEEEASFADEADELARRKGKAPESRPTLNASRPSGSGDAMRDSDSPELSVSRVEDSSPPTGTGTSTAARVMNTTALRALGSANPTVTPSDSVAFTLSVRDATLLNFSSDVLPHEVLQTLRRRFQGWIANSSFKWATVQSSEKTRSCIEARLERKKSEWNSGPEYACAMCDRRMRLCVVVDTGEHLLLLPRKDAEDQEEGPADASYWMR